MTPRMSLVEDFESRKIGCLKEQKRNEARAIPLYIISLVATAAASFAAAGTFLAPKKVVVTLVAIPGVITAVLTTFKFDVRAQWW